MYCSKGRNGHVPYRDSKLTRILQNSLGGNARTAIICTMSPAHSHLEQSRNTLLFATCAKQVTTNARVNVVMSDKALVKHLRKELARLEKELAKMSLVSSKGDVTAVLKEKELQIEKVNSFLFFGRGGRPLGSIEAPLAFAFGCYCFFKRWSKALRMCCWKQDFTLQKHIN